jgi:uncharacterized protein
MTFLRISNQRRILEIAAVLLTAAGKFIFMDWLQWKFPFITLAVVGWTCYVIVRARQVPGILEYWGFRMDTLKPVVRMVLPFGIMALGTFFAIGFNRATINLTWHIIPVLILYPVWGIIQQFLVVALVAGNLNDIKSHTMPQSSTIFLTALLFGLLHYPNYWLIIGTFVLALFYGYVYLRERNLYVLGIFHGWLGGTFYYTVVGRDPFAEVFAPVMTN